MRKEPFDWSLFAIVVTVVAVMPLQLGAPDSLLLRLVRSASPPSLTKVYDQALQDAAVRLKDRNMRLNPIDVSAETIAVVMFTYRTPKSGDLEEPVWVTEKAALKEACAGEPDPQLALKQILGLPPSAAPRKLYELNVPPLATFRPCMVVTELSATECPIAPQKAQPELNPQQAEDHAYVVQHSWKALRRGFLNEYASPRDYPFDGFPFTGLGWTYNWNPRRTTPFGVPELVVRKGTKIEVKGELKPRDFCAPKI